MKKLLDQVSKELRPAFSEFLRNGEKQIESSQKWCGLTIDDFALFFIENASEERLLMQAKFTLTADTESALSLQGLMCQQEFARDYFEDWADHNVDTIVTQFNKEVRDHQMESAVIAANM